MHYDDQYNPFSSSRTTVYAAQGVVACSHPAAAETGRQILQQGGNAVDAAIAVAAALAVLEPTSNGLGGDCFALVHDGRQLHALNASGWSPAALKPDIIQGATASSIPRFGWPSVTVPGAMAGWHALQERFGSLGTEELLTPLIRQLEHGVPVPPVIAGNWKRAAEIYTAALSENGSVPAEFQPWFDTFLPGGKAPLAGDLWSQEGQMKTLRVLQKEGFTSLYQGSLAEALLEYSSATGGLLTQEDLQLYQPEWVQAVSTNYRGYDVWEIPPNGQGITALMALGMRSADHISGGWGSPAELHLDIEAMKLAFADTQAYVTDPRFMKTSSSDLLNPDYLAQRRGLITEFAGEPVPGSPYGGGTVYFCCADSRGMMVSFIQSNYMGFGSGLVIPGYGISLQNRACNFSVDPQHPNCLEGRKRPYHTIIPGFLTRNNEPLAAFGVMGGFMQPQGHMQVIRNLLDHEFNPQAALDAPRWQWMSGKKVLFENDFPAHSVRALQRKGHQADFHADPGLFGRGQIIVRDPRGVYAAGCEKRCDSAIAIL
ncbi:gamma-glutamyltransferase family protein [Spirochaeta dissipatitropha]